ncbi:MAG: hypothetical protein H0W08_24765 [Acidobacteria bacterium]|nr:hypothetical protein [Acidobacteriota bacterium]
MHRFLIWSLLVFTPFTGVRMICVERPPQSVAADVAGDCDQFCLRPSARATEGVHGDVDCALLADGAVFMVVSGVAVLPAQIALRIVVETRVYESAVTDSYRSPAVAHPLPPPKV